MLTVCIRFPNKWKHYVHQLLFLPVTYWVGCDPRAAIFVMTWNHFMLLSLLASYKIQFDPVRAYSTEISKDRQLLLLVCLNVTVRWNMTYESEYFWKVFFNRLQFGKKSIIDFWLSEYTIAICDRKSGNMSEWCTYSV